MTGPIRLAALGIIVPLFLLAAQDPAPHSYVPPEGFVPDATTAARIAVAVWIPIYGAAQIESEKPYTASLSGGVWSVQGSLPAGSVGGTAYAEIAKSDGRIIRVTHGK